jgi:hypothetical protein
VEPIQVNQKVIDELQKFSQGGSWARFAMDATTACKHRKLFHTQKGYIGVGPKGMDCSILFGAKVPLILRQMGHQYVLIGEAYIHGVMRGKVVAMWRDGGLEAEERSAEHVHPLG